MKRSSAALLLCALLIASPASAADDTTDAREVISKQADAFGRDDGAAAYGFAAPGIQGMFDLDTFMGMVRRSYVPVYRHKSFEFGDTSLKDGAIRQSVHIVDAEGVAWEALYTLERQGDGSLKITGCTLLKADQNV